MYMTPALAERFHYVYLSATLCNEAVTEISFISHSVLNSEELKIANNHTFNFFRVALQYCFNSEYTKLLEKDQAKDRGKPTKHISSLFKLNEIIYEMRGENFEQAYLLNKELLYGIINDNFFDTQLLLRNKKFSHSDFFPGNDPLKIKGLTEFEVKTAFEHLIIMFKVINNCSNPFNYTYSSHVPYKDERTLNFIKNQAVYKKYFYDNYAKAISEGYNLQ